MVCGFTETFPSLKPQFYGMDKDLLKYFNYHEFTQNFFPKILKDFNVQMTM